MTISPRGQLQDLRQLTTASLELDGPLSLGGWQAPRSAQLRDGWLLTAMDATWHDVRPAKGMLEGFLRLATASEERILQYSTTWGALPVCDEHMLPAHHMLRSVGDRAFRLDECRVREFDGAWATPIATWRYWAGQAKSILEIAVKLHDRKLPTQEDWSVLGETGLRAWQEDVWEIAPYVREHVDEEGRKYVVPRPRYGEPLLSSERFLQQSTRSVLKKHSFDEAIYLQRNALSRAVQVWLRMANVTPSFHWGASDPSVMLAGGGVFGAIGVQLMLRVSRSDGLAMCNGCGEPYVPTRKPSPGKRHYCQNCRSAKVPLRDAAAAFRKRKKGEHGQTSER